MSSGIWDDEGYNWDDPRITWVGAVISTPQPSTDRACYVSLALLRLEDEPFTPSGDRAAYVAFAELEIPGPYEPPPVQNPVIIATPGGGMYVPMGRPHDPHRIRVRP